MPDIFFPPNQARFVDTEREIFGWDFDDNKLAEVLAENGIELDVSLRFSSSDSHDGKHSVMKRGDRVFHRIIIVDTLSPEAANETLWHEIRHAIQNEILVRDSGLNWKKDWKKIVKLINDRRAEVSGPRGQTYWLRETEIDARKFAADNKHIPLVWF